MIFSSVIYLSLVFQARDVALSDFSGLHHVLLQTHFFPVVRPSPLSLFPAMCPVIPGKSQVEDIPLSRPVPVYGLWSIGLSGKLARHRSLRAQSSKLYHMGIPGGVSRKYTLQRQQGARLVHLRRFRPIPDPSCTSLVCRRGLSSGSGQHCICTRFINNRPVPVSLSLGAVPFNQIRRQIAHSAGLAWEYSNFHPHLQREITRRKCPEYSGSGSRGILCHGSWLPGFRPSLPDEQRRRLLRDPHQIEHAVSSSLFPSSRQVNRSQMRPNHSADRKQIENRLPPTTPSRQVSRPRKRKNLRFPDQQCRNPGQNGSNLYRFRWRVELFFKWIKQHLRIKSFYGT